MGELNNELVRTGSARRPMSGAISHLPGLEWLSRTGPFQGKECLRISYKSKDACGKSRGGDGGVQGD